MVVFVLRSLSHFLRSEASFEAFLKKRLTTFVVFHPSANTIIYHDVLLLFQTIGLILKFSRAKSRSADNTSRLPFNLDGNLSYVTRNS